MPALVNYYITTRPYEDNEALAAPVSGDFLNALIVFKDTAIFGICLGFVYGLSALVVMTLSSQARLSLSKRQKIDNYGPVLLTGPFWASVLVMSSRFISGTVLAAIHLPFMESVFWAMVVWAVFVSVSVFTIIAVLICLIRRPSDKKDTVQELCSFVDSCDSELKSPREPRPEYFEEATPRTLEEPPTGDFPVVPPTSPVQRPCPPCDATPDRRPRMGSVTRCWH